MTNNNTQIPSLFKSVEVLANRQRKNSSDPQNQRKQENDLPKVPAMSADLVISLIQKKMSQTSELSQFNKDKVSSPQLTGQKDPLSYSNSPPSKMENKTSIGQNQQKNTNFRINDNNIFTRAKGGRQPQLKKEEYVNKQKLRQQGLSEEEDYNLKSEVNLGTAINWRSIWLFAKLILFSYEFNLLDYLRSIDAEVTEEVVDILKISPGYKPIQYIYVFYTLKYGIAVGVATALLYPLPYSILFLMIPVDLNVPFVAIFMLAGMRSGALALLLKYCLHFPKQAFHWIVLIFTVLIGIVLPNNYIFIVLFAISIFLSFYIKQNANRTSISEERSSMNSATVQPSVLNASAFGLNFNQKEIYKYYKVYDKLPQTYANLSLLALSSALVLMWVLQRYFENRELSIFGQVIPISMLVNSKEMLAFFPYIYNQTIGSSTLSPNTLISLSFLFPGPHAKAFMFFIIHTEIDHVVIGYGCLYLPTILLTNIFIGYRHYFYTFTYYNIRQSIQAVGNGIVFCLVIWMLRNQECFFNSLCYSAVVIMVVAKLYKLRELFAITLGIFLISARTIIQNINKGIPFQKQACLNQTLTL